MADGAVHEWVDIAFTDMLLGPIRLITQGIAIHIELIRVPLPVEFGNTIYWPQMLIRLTVATDTPCHGELLRLVNLLHLVDSTVAGHATDTGIHVGGVVEVDKRRQVMNARPRDTAAQIPTLAYWPKLYAGRMNRSQGCYAVFALGTMAIDARRSRRHCRVGGVKNRVVAITTVQLQLSSVNRVAEGDGLSRLVADVQSHGVGNQSAHGTCKNNARSRCYRKNAQKWIDPTRKQKPLHDLFGRRSTRSPVPH